MAQIKFISRPALLAAGCLFLLSAAAVFAAGEPQVKEEDLRVVSPVSGGGSPGQELKPFREGELWGFKNAAGETAVAPVFDRAEDFREGLAPVLLHGKWGYLDGAGRMALEPRYDGWNHFSGGQALVKLNGEWVTINAAGAVTERPAARDRSEYKEGLAFFRSGEKYGYADPAGDTQIAPSFDEARDFSEGLAAVKKGKWGFIYKNGDFAIQPEFEAVGQFREGLAPFLKDGTWGFLNRKGKPEIANNFDEAQPFREGLAAVRLNSKWGYIDKVGRIAIRPGYLEAQDFSDGRAIVAVYPGAAAYSRAPQAAARRWIDKAGKTLLQSAGAERDGLQPVVAPDGRYGYAGRSWLVLTPEFEDAKTCLDNLCLVKKNGRYVFIDHGGAVKLETPYEDASGPACGFYRVKSGGKYGFIDSAGSAVAPLVYDVLEKDACVPQVKAVLDGRFGCVLPLENWRFAEGGSPKDGPAAPLARGATAQEPAPAPAAETEVPPVCDLVRANRAEHLVSFEFNVRPQLLPVRTPLSVNVLLKRRFNGKLRIYPTDLNRLVLLDLKRGEYLKSLVLEVNGVPGRVFAVDVGLLPAGDFPGLQLGAEVAETASLRDTRYHAKITEAEAIAAPPGGDWFPDEAVENLLLVPQNRFGAARAKKLLAADSARAEKALPQLVRWFTQEGARRTAAEEGLKAIIAAHGGAGAVAQFGALLGDNDLRVRKKWLEAMRLCGSDARSAAEEIKVFFEDEDKEIRESAFALYRELGLDLPAEYAAAAGAALPAAPAPPAPAAATAESSVPASGYAAAVSTGDPLQAIEAAEKALAGGPPAEESAQLYLQLGRLKKSAEGDAAYAQQRPGEYARDEIGDRYLYNGKHFMHLLVKYPDSSQADEAAYELTKLNAGGECEGFTDCYIGRQFGQVSQFLKDRPGSRFAAEAVARANEAFTANLKEAGDLNAPRERYDPEKVKELLRQYDNLAALFPKRIRTKAFLVIAELWAKFLDYDRAKGIYKALLADEPDEATAQAAKEGLAAIPAANLILAPVKVSGSAPPELEWTALQADETPEYAVYRSSDDPPAGQAPANFSRLARVQGTQFSDISARPGAAYWYYVEASTSKGAFPSNKVRSTVSAPAVPGTP